MNPVGTFTGGGLTSVRSVSFDNAGNVWTADPGATVYTGGGNQTSYYGRITEHTSAGVARSPANGFAANSTYYASSVVNDSFGNAWAVAQNNLASLTAITELDPNGNILSGNNGYQDATLAYPYQIAIDGNNHIWTMSLAPVTAPPGSYLIELDNSGHFVSGPTGLLLPSAVIPCALAIDSSGNLWLPAISSLIQETIGVAAPTVTPLSLAVKNRSVGTLP